MSNIRGTYDLADQPPSNREFGHFLVASQSQVPRDFGVNLVLHAVLRIVGCKECWWVLFTPVSMSFNTKSALFQWFQNYQNHVNPQQYYHALANNLLYYQEFTLDVYMRSTYTTRKYGWNHICHLMSQTFFRPWLLYLMHRKLIAPNLIYRCTVQSSGNNVLLIDILMVPGPSRIWRRQYPLESTRDSC